MDFVWSDCNDRGRLYAWHVDVPYTHAGMLGHAYDSGAVDGSIERQHFAAYVANSPAHIADLAAFFDWPEGAECSSAKADSSKPYNDDTSDDD